MRPGRTSLAFMNVACQEEEEEKEKEEEG